MTSPTTPAGHPLVPDTASWLRRIGALFIDWIAASLVAAAIVGGFEGSAYQWLPLAVFWFESAVGVALVGSSFGQKLLGISVHTLDNRPLPLLRAFERQLLVCLVIPPLVFRQDGRGLHDLLTNSAAYDTRATRA
jgi:hypothetical protein